MDLAGSFSVRCCTNNTCLRSGLSRNYLFYIHFYRWLRLRSNDRVADASAALTDPGTDLQRIERLKRLEESTKSICH